MDFAAARRNLIEQLRSEVKDQKVLEVMARLPRECFVPSESRYLAYEDRPVPIGFGQTISQPFIVALMTQALELTGTEKVLELGTGSGYQTAILAELAARVVSIERLPQLADSAKTLLEQLGYTNIEIHYAEKTLGWAQVAPYDAIIVTASVPKVPTALLDQLSPSGRIVIPVGSRYEQELVKVSRQGDRWHTEELGGCRFVPLIGEGSWEEEEG